MEYEETRRVDQQKPNIQKKHDNEGVRRDPLRDLPEWLVELKAATHPVLLVNYCQNREQNWYRASIVFVLTSRKTEIATSA